MASYTVYNQQADLERERMDRMEAAEKRANRFGWNDLLGLLNAAAGVYGTYQNVQAGKAGQTLAEDKLAFGREGLAEQTRQSGLDELVRQGEVMRGLGDKGYEEVPQITGGYGDVAKLLEVSAGVPTDPDFIGPQPRPEPIDFGTSFPDLPGRSFRQTPLAEDIGSYYVRDPATGALREKPSQMFPEAPMPEGMGEDYHLYAGQPYRKPGRFSGAGGASTPYSVPDPSDPARRIPASAQMIGDWYRGNTDYGPSYYEEVDPRTGEATRVPSPFKTDVMRDVTGHGMPSNFERATILYKSQNKYYSGSEKDLANIREIEQMFTFRDPFERIAPPQLFAEVQQAIESENPAALQAVVMNVAANGDDLLISTLQTYLDWITRSRGE